MRRTTVSRVAGKDHAARTRKDWARILEGVRGTITYEASLQAYTSFHIGGPAEVLVEPADVEDLCRVVAQARAEHIPVFVVGGTMVANLRSHKKGWDDQWETFSQWAEKGQQ